jgi:hypothetical protein
MIRKRTFIIGAILSTALFIIGFMSWGGIFITLLPEIDGVYITDDPGGVQFRSNLLLGFTLALIPLATIFIWKLGPVSSPGKRTLSVAIIVTGIIFSVFLRRELLKFVAVPIDYNIRLEIPLEQVKFDFYALVGLIVGSVLAWLILKDKKIST